MTPMTQMTANLPRLHATTHDTYPVVLHVAGPENRRHRIAREAEDAIFSRKVDLSHDTRMLTILTWSDSLANYQLTQRCMDHLGIEYRTLIPPREWGKRGWENWLKIRLTAKCLASARWHATPYVIGIDANDVMLLDDPNEVLWRFLTMTGQSPPDNAQMSPESASSKPNCRLLFSAERNHYPRGLDLEQETLAEKSLAELADEMPFCHLNAGCFIGTWDAAAKWFTVAAEQKRSQRAPGSDQACWRRFWWKTGGEVDIDRRQEIFATVAGKYDPADVVELVDR